MVKIFAFFFPIRVVKKKRDQESFKRLWYESWLEKGYYDFPEQPLEEFGAYDHLSVDFLVKFLGLIPCATVRIIKDSKDLPLIVLRDFSILEKPWKDESGVREVTLLSVKKSFRGRLRNLVLLVLLRMVIKYGIENELEGIVAAVDKRFYILLRVVGIPFRPIGEEKFYQGSVTIPVFVGREDLSKIREKNPFLLS